MRLRIAMRNLLISESIIIVFLIFAYFVWFPYSFIELGGFYETAFMLILVDLILGPCLVFFIYKEGKKYLAFDVNFLLTIQLLAFFYGAYSMYLKHPAYAVLFNNGFKVVNVSSLYPDMPWYKQINTHFFTSPTIVDIPKISTTNRKDILIDIFVNGGPDIYYRTKYFNNLDNSMKLILDKSIPIEKISEALENKNKIHSVIHKLGGNITDYVYIPIQGNNQKQMTWIINRESLKPVGIVDINSSKYSDTKRIAQNRAY